MTSSFEAASAAIQGAITAAREGREDNADAVHAEIALAEAAIAEMETISDQLKRILDD
jgi:hypothetical protein